MARIRIGLCAPSSRMDPAVPDKVAALAGRLYGPERVELVVHPQCFAVGGHFAGDDSTRLAAFADIANDPAIDALWFGRGGYGACRLTEGLLAALGPAARAKTYLGYSDAGSILGALYGAGYRRIAHGPMPSDINRTGGAAAVERALAFLVEGAAAALEPGLDGRPVAAFNLTILCHLLGTPYQPDLDGHVLLVEEVSEYLYRIDRDFCQLAANAGLRRLAGLRLGRCGDIPPNDPEFGQTEEEIARHWCRRAGIAYLGRADIGHDADNKVVPFGTWRGA